MYTGDASAEMIVTGVVGVVNVVVISLLMVNVS